MPTAPPSTEGIPSCSHSTPSTLHPRRLTRRMLSMNIRIRPPVGPPRRAQRAAQSADTARGAWSVRRERSCLISNDSGARNPRAAAVSCTALPKRTRNARRGARAESIGSLPRWTGCRLLHTSGDPRATFPTVSSRRWIGTATTLTFGFAAQRMNSRRSVRSVSSFTATVGSVDSIMSSTHRAPEGIAGTV